METQVLSIAHNVLIRIVENSKLKYEQKTRKETFWQKCQIFETSENQYEQFLTLSTIIMIVGLLSTGSAVHARIISRKGRARAV